MRTCCWQQTPCRRGNAPLPSLLCEEVLENCSTASQLSAGFGAAVGDGIDARRQPEGCPGAARQAGATALAGQVGAWAGQAPGTVGCCRCWAACRRSAPRALLLPAGWAPLAWWFGSAFSPTFFWSCDMLPRLTSRPAGAWPPPPSWPPPSPFCTPARCCTET